MEVTTPTIVKVPSRVIKNHTNDDNNTEHSHIKAAATKIIIRIGSWAMVNRNIANGGPKTKKTPPKNSGNVIFD